MFTKLPKIQTTLIASMLMLSACTGEVAFNKWNAPTEGPNGSQDPVGLIVSPQTIDFGNTLINTSAKSTVTVRNNTADSYVLDFSKGATGEFSADSSKCSKLAPQQVCKFDVTFKPTLATTYSQQPIFRGRRTQKDKNGLDVISESEDATGLNLRGKGFIIPPSPADKLTVVGWYSYKQPTKVAMDNSNPSFKDCKPVVAGNVFNMEDYGREEEYCYEPSGAHGMVLPTSDFSKLTSYILQTGSTFNSVGTLDELFSKPEDLKSDNVCWKEALFYYALSYVLVPRNYDLKDANNDIRFSLTNVDDGIQLVSNGNVTGRIHLGANTNFSLHKGQDGTQSALKNGPNTIVALWIDDCAGGRLIKDARVTDKSGNEVARVLPNVVSGYVYDTLNGVAVKNTKVVIKNSQGTILATTKTDSSGFYQAEGLPDGFVSVDVYSGSQVAKTTTATLDHKTATTAAVDLTVGI